MRYITTFILVLFLSSCQTDSDNQMTDKKDYDKYLVSNPPKTSSKYFELWNSKIKPDSSQLMSFGIVGGEYNRYFQNTRRHQIPEKSRKSAEKSRRYCQCQQSGNV